MSSISEGFRELVLYDFSTDFYKTDVTRRTRAIVTIFL